MVKLCSNFIAAEQHTTELQKDLRIFNLQVHICLLSVLRHKIRNVGYGMYKIKVKATNAGESKSRVSDSAELILHKVALVIEGELGQSL